MPNDAKLGLVLGMGLVVVIALVFFRKDPLSAQPHDTRSKTMAPKAPRSDVEYPAPPPIIPPPPVEPTFSNPLVEPPPPVLPPGD